MPGRKIEIVRCDTRASVGAVVATLVNWSRERLDLVVPGGMSQNDQFMLKLDLERVPAVILYTVAQSRSSGPEGALVAATFTTFLSASSGASREQVIQAFAKLAA